MTGTEASQGRRLPAVVRVAYPPGGKIVTATAQVADGQLTITDTYQAVYLGDAWTGNYPPDAYILTLRQAELNGGLVLDPARSKALAAEAGLADPPRQVSS